MEVTVIVPLEAAMADVMLAEDSFSAVFVRLGRGEVGSDGGSWKTVAAGSVEAAGSGGGGVVSLVIVAKIGYEKSVERGSQVSMSVLLKCHPLYAGRGPISSA
jgi:hypothetical protein